MSSVGRVVDCPTLTLNRRAYEDRVVMLAQHDPPWSGIDTPIAT